VEIPASTFDDIRRNTYKPVTLAFAEEEALAAILTDCRADGTDDISLSLRFDHPAYGLLAKKLGHQCVISIEGSSYHARLHAIHPEGVNHVAITARFK
jgi:hypothetical protein